MHMYIHILSTRSVYGEKTTAAPPPFPEASRSPVEIDLLHPKRPMVSRKDSVNMGQRNSKDVYKVMPNS